MKESEDYKRGWNDCRNKLLNQLHLSANMYDWFDGTEESVARAVRCVKPKKVVEKLQRVQI